MNNKEIVCYLLGAIGDVTRDEAVKALKNFTELNEQELINFRTRFDIILRLVSFS